jgi:mycothiol synthase
MSRFVVSPAAAHELLPACRLLFADGFAEQRRDRLLSDAQTTGLFVARDASGRLHAAALVQALPGALGVAWPPRGDSTEAIDAVTVAACDWLRSHGAKVCQAFAPATEVADMAPLERHGFRHTTQLVFLSRDVSSGYELAPYLSFVAVRQPFPEDFSSTLLATHLETRDCPELNAARTPDEICAGFVCLARAGSYLVWCGGEPVGVVMFEPIDAPGAAELTYIGVVPGLRGRGLGAELLKFAITEAAIRWEAVLNLSVDARNAPAMALYSRHGFIEYDRREVWLATWPA